jgi:hypothetical protein
VNTDEYQIDVSDGAGFLRIVARGQYSRRRFDELLQRIVSEIQSRGVWRVLVHVTGVPGPIPVLDRYEAGVSAAGALRAQTRIAVVERSDRSERFFETVARNRGLSIRDFAGEPAAREWLLGP